MRDCSRWRAKLIEIQRAATHVVARVLGGRSLTTCLRELAQRNPQLTAQQRAAIQDACYGTLRFLGRLDALLDQLLERPLTEDVLRCLLRVALYQLEYSRAAPYAVVDEAVTAAAALHHARAKGLVNAVLRNFLRRRAELAAAVAHSEVARYSHPQWWIDLLKREYPQHYAAILETANHRPPLTLRVNRRKNTPQQYCALLAESGLAARSVGEDAVTLEQPVGVDRLPGFADGRVSVQDAGAQLAAPLLDLAPGMRVLDACAAPGGKTAHILECADVELVALDDDAARLERVRANLSRSGFTARIECADAARPDEWWDGRPFHRVLADVPCSASGVVRRHPDIKWLRRPGDIEQFAGQQGNLLDALWRVVAGGGKLLYATCSVFAGENGARIAAFLKRHPEARQLPLPGLAAITEAPAGQLLPDTEHDGFYYALLQKI